MELFTMKALSDARPTVLGAMSVLHGLAPVLPAPRPASYQAGNAVVPAPAEHVGCEQGVMADAFPGGDIQDVTGRKFWNRTGPPSGRSPV